MKKNERNELKEKLLTAIKKTIQNSKADLTHKAEKTLKKAIKQIVKKTGKNMKNIVKLKNRNVGLRAEKVKLNGNASKKAKLTSV